MAEGYWVVAYHQIHDDEKLQAYLALAPGAIQAGGGRFLVRGMAAEIHEAGIDNRIVVVEFPSLDAAIACHASDEYQAALAALDGAATRDLRIVGGVEQPT